MSQNMQIGRKDVIWNFAATFMRVASGLIVLPLVLRLLPSPDVGLWNIFLSIGSIAALLDFGFSNAFSRNITYVFSGVKTLQSKGYSSVDKNDTTIDFGLLKSVISAMRRYYAILAIIFLAIFLAISHFYMSYILEKEHYTGDIKTVWISWFTYGGLVAYQLYTYYYGSLLTGRGLVKRNLQIIIVSQGFRIISTIILLLLGFGLFSLVVGFFVSDFLNRTLCYYAFYDKKIKHDIKVSKPIPVNEVMKIMTPNAVKIGVTTLGGFLITRGILLISPLYLSLPQIASYGTTKQMIDLIASIGGIWFSTYYPKVTLYRVNDQMDGVKRLYIKGKLALIFVFIICGLGIIFVGPPLLDLIHSKTHLIPGAMIFVFLIVAFLESNQSISSGYLLTKNEVPFMKASIFSGLAVLILLFASFYFTDLGIWGMILAPGIAQISYQNWKWPLLVSRELKLTIADYKKTLKDTFKKENVLE